MDIKLSSEKLTLKEAYKSFQGDPPSAIPFLVWLIENPDSPLALPGKIYLREHDYLHILLSCDRSSTGEAFVIGFTMGNDPSTNWLHLVIFKFISRYLYPKIYRFSLKDFKYFERGFTSGNQLSIKGLNQFDFQDWQDKPLDKLRNYLEINLQDIQ